MVLSGDSAPPTQSTETQSTLLSKEQKTGNLLSHDWCWAPSHLLVMFLPNLTSFPFTPGHNITQMSSDRPYASASCCTDSVLLHNVIRINSLHRHLDVITSSPVFDFIGGFFKSA